MAYPEVRSLDAIFGPKKTSSRHYEHVRKFRATMKRRLFVGFGSRCGVCGVVDHPIIYDFHHRNPAEKDFTPARKIRSWDKVVAEILKCVMLCVPCHRKVHAGFVTIPSDAPVFDESLIAESDVAFKEGLEMDNCPVCSSQKPAFRKACSHRCAAFLKTHYKMPSDARVLIASVIERGYSGTAKIYDVSADTVKNWIIRSGNDLPKYHRKGRLSRPPLVQQQNVRPITERSPGQHGEGGPTKRGYVRERRINDGKLQRLFAASASIKDMAFEFGVTKGAIRKRAKYLGIDDSAYRQRRKVYGACLECDKQLSGFQVRFCTQSCAAKFNNRLRLKNVA